MDVNFDRALSLGYFFLVLSAAGALVLSDFTPVAAASTYNSPCFSFGLAGLVPCKDFTKLASV